jgi:guanylate kinase
MPKFLDNYYGTLKKNINNKIKQNKTIILDIDWQGARQIKKQLPKITTTIFILPPSLKELKKRLTKRESNTKFINLRMSKAKKEITHWKEYDYVVVNDNLKKCISEIKSILNLLDRKPKYLKVFFFFNNKASLQNILQLNFLLLDHIIYLINFFIISF